MTTRRTILAAAVSAALLLTAAGQAPIAEAATKTTHCATKTTWKLAGQDEDGTTRIKLWWKPSGTKELAFCVESWDLRKSKYDLLTAASSDQAALGSWWTATSVSKLIHTLNTIASFYTEAGVAFPETQGGRHVVFTGWWK